MFAIVKFTEEEDAPAIVATNWIDVSRNVCYYPNVRTEFQKNKLLLGRAEPKPDWDQCPMKLLREFASYVSAKEHLSDAELTSNLESDAEVTGIKKRRRKEKIVLLPGEDHSSSESEPELSRGKKNCSTPKGCRFPTPPPPPPSVSSKASPSARSVLSPPNIHSAFYSGPQQPRPLTIEIPLVSSDSPASSGSNSSNSIGRSYQSDLQHLKTNQDLMWKVLGEITTQNERLETKLDLVLQHLQTQPCQPHQAVGAETHEEELLISQLPIKAEDFDTLEAKLKEPAIKHRLIKFLQAIGGRDVKLLAAGLMRKLFLDEIGEIYSLTGKAGKEGPGKKPFLKTESFRLVYDICLRKHTNAEESQIREAVSDWLMQAKFRKLRRENRKNKHQPQPQGDDDV